MLLYEVFYQYCTLLFSAPPEYSKRSVFADLECLVPFFNSNRHRDPAQAKAVTPATTDTPWQAGFLKPSWKGKSPSHFLRFQEDFNNSTSAPGISYYRAKRLEKSSALYQSTRTGTVSKLIDLSPCTTPTLAVSFPVP